MQKKRRLCLGARCTRMVTFRMMDVRPRQYEILPLRCVIQNRTVARFIQHNLQRSVLSRKGRSQDKSRTIPFRPPEKLQSKYPPNVVRNQKYNVFTFLPLVFYEQFKFFFNLYFLLVALSQFVPALKIGA